MIYTSLKHISLLQKLFISLVGNVYRGYLIIPGPIPLQKDGIRPGIWASLVAQAVKNHLQCRRRWVGNIPWRRAWQLTPVFLPGEPPRTEEPGGLQSMQSQNQTRLSD